MSYDCLRMRPCLLNILMIIFCMMHKEKLMFFHSYSGIEDKGYIFCFNVVLRCQKNFKEVAEVLGSEYLTSSLKSYESFRNAINFFWQFQPVGYALVPNKIDILWIMIMLQFSIQYAIKTSFKVCCQSVMETISSSLDMNFHVSWFLVQKF